MGRKKGAAVAIIAVVAVIGGLLAYSAIPRQEERGPEPVLTTIDRSDKTENDSTTIAEDVGQQPQESAYYTTVLAKSSDGGTFNTTEIGDGMLAYVAASGDNAYLAWVQDGDLFFVASTDGGETFGEAENIKSEGTSYWPRIAVAENAYVAWTETAGENSDIMIVGQ